MQHISVWPRGVGLKVLRQGYGVIFPLGLSIEIEGYLNDLLALKSRVKANGVETGEIRINCSTSWGRFPCQAHPCTAAIQERALEKSAGVAKSVAALLSFIVLSKI